MLGWGMGAAVGWPRQSLPAASGLLLTRVIGLRQWLRFNSSSLPPRRPDFVVRQVREGDLPLELVPARAAKGGRHTRAAACDPVQHQLLRLNVTIDSKV